MLTPLTKTAIAVLQDIESGMCLRSAHILLPEEELDTLLCQLETGSVIRRLPSKADKRLLSYELSRPLHGLSLLELLQAIGEPIFCNAPLSESDYLNHGPVARKIGVLNHMARVFLSEIKMSDW